MSGQKTVTPSADGLATTIREAGKAQSRGGLPPVHLWNPPFCGDLDMRIARDGRWYYKGSPIGRFEMVKLFSSILKREDGKYYLVTPVEKVGITVDDAPFVAVDIEVGGTGEQQVLTFTTHVGDETCAGPDFPIRMQQDQETGEPAPYVMVRDGLEALIDRKSFYRLVELGEHSEDWFGVRSNGVFFPLVPSADLA